MTENLGEIFDEVKGMGREGQQRFRDLVQQHPFWTVTASSQALFEDVQARDAPFYGFFKVQHLGMFDLEEAIELLENLARQERRGELRRFFRTEAGQGRVRAVHKLTGGNPRLLVIFYQFIDRESIDDLAPPFLEMVDSLTSYYQEQMQPLPALQQKIVEFLCEHRIAATVKDIARSCFVTPQTASKQLGRLTDRRYVVANRVGRESFYELREPLFRICFEVKENLGYPIRLFVDFLGNFYSLEELRRRYRSARIFRTIYQVGGKIPLTRKIDTELGYLAEALSAYHSIKPDELEPSRRLGHDLEKTLDELIAERDYSEITKLGNAAYELVYGSSDFLPKRVEEARRELDGRSEALERFRKFVESERENLGLLLDLAKLEEFLGASTAAEEKYLRALQIDGENVAALVGLGRIKVERGDDSGALSFLQQAGKLDPENGLVWVSLAATQAKLGKLDDARHSLSRAETLILECPDRLNSLGEVFRALGDYEGAIRCYRQYLQLESTDCYANFNIALALFESGDPDAGLKQMEIAARTGRDQDWSHPLPLSISKVGAYLLQEVESDQLPRLYRGQLKIFKDSPLRRTFIQGLIGALMGTIKKHDELALDRLVELRDRVLPVFSGIEELSVACRFFATGVSYLESRNRRVLLGLPREERQSLEEILASSESEAASFSSSP